LLRLKTTCKDLKVINQDKALLPSTGKGLAKYTMSVAVMMTGVAAHKIRRFEGHGLCIPARTSSRQRLYSDEDIRRIREIVLLEQDGINLAGVKAILALKNGRSKK
jgi:DNA-binding transcriptional MerR regulator